MQPSGANLQINNDGLTTLSIQAGIIAENLDPNSLANISHSQKGQLPKAAGTTVKPQTRPSDIQSPHLAQSAWAVGCFFWLSPEPCHAAPRVERIQYRNNFPYPPCCDATGFETNAFGVMVPSFRQHSSIFHNSSDPSNARNLILLALRCLNHCSHGHLECWRKPPFRPTPLISPVWRTEHRHPSRKTSPLPLASSSNELNR
jgi:hypothetical protein